MDCLTSVYADLIDIDAECFVVDNASSDGSVAAVQSDFPKVSIICNDSNTGFSHANNQALRIAKGKICLLLNSDTIPQPGFVSAILEAFQTLPNAGVIGLKLLNPDNTIQPSWGNFASAWTEFIFQSFLFKLVPASFPLGRQIHSIETNGYVASHPVDWVTGACLAVRREVLERAGFLDESNFMYGEDMEWCWRINKAGYKVWFWTDGSVVHLARQSSQRNYTSWISRYTQGQLMFIGQHRSLIEFRLAGLFVCLGSILRILIWTFVPILKKARKNEASQRRTGYFLALKMGFQALMGKLL